MPEIEFWQREGVVYFVIPNPIFSLAWGYLENLVQFCSVETEILNLPGAWVQHGLETRTGTHCDYIEKPQPKLLLDLAWLWLGLRLRFVNWNFLRVRVDVLVNSDSFSFSQIIVIWLPDPEIQLTNLSLSPSQSQAK